MPRTLIIGDIHGCWAELQELLDRAGLSAGDTILSVGDLVDRGPEPGPVVDFFRSGGTDGVIRRVICGNHERKHVRGLLSFSQQIARLQLMAWAGKAGEGDAGAEPEARYAEIVRWMAGLPFHVEQAGGSQDGYRAVHWGLYPGVPLDEVPEDVRAGTTSGDAKLRERYGERPWYDFYTDDIPVAFGHAVVGDEPLIVRDRVYGLDTGCCHGGRLTGLILPERRIVQVQARGDGWARSRAEWQVPVMKAHPWPEMTWAQLRKKVEGLRDPEAGAAEVAATIAEILAWSERVKALIPTLGERLDEELARLQELHPEECDSGQADSGANEMSAAIRESRKIGAVGIDASMEERRRQPLSSIEQRLQPRRSEFGAAASAHPAGSWLLRLRRGRLSREFLGCETPKAVFTLAAALGVEHAVAARP